MDESRKRSNNNSKRKNYYRNNDPRRRKFNQYLVCGLKGFICTCNYNEERCVREAYNILNEYSETPEPDTLSVVEGSTDEDDIERVLNTEVAALQAEISRGSNSRKFQVVDTGAKNCLFIRTMVPDPVQLVVRILEDIALTKKQKSRFLLRMLPIEITCKAKIKDMEEAFKPLVEKHFSSDGKTFSVIYRARYNDSVSRDEIIDSFAGLVKNAHPLNRADLNNPQLAVLVEIIKGICCIGVVPRFTELRKYNLLELASHVPKPKEGDHSKSGDSVVENNTTEIHELGQEEKEDKMNAEQEIEAK